VGIIFIENGSAMVYHAVEPVSRNTIDEFIDMSEDGRYEIRRLKDQGSLTPEVVQQMRSEAQTKLGLHYDLAFDWSDEEMYCSEYVWKIYRKVLKIEIGRPRPLKEFDLSHPLVRSALHSRYGNNIPFSGKMISPGDMYVSPLVE
jgi:hypothetical protein